MTYYKQCVLRRKGNTGKIVTTVWIPENFAKTGKILKRKLEGMWDEGWKVIKVYSLRKAEESVLRDRDAHLHQRKRSDI